MATLMPSTVDTSMDAFRAALPDGLGQSVIASELCALGDLQQLSKGETVAGDPLNDRLVYIASGAAKLVAQPCGSTEGTGAVQVLAFHFSGDMVSVLRQGDGDFRLIALADCQLITFPTDAFLDIAQADPAVLRWVLTSSLQALHRTRTRMMQLGHKSARQRIADFLVSMAERLSDGTSGACRLILPMSRRDIGDSLGLTIETVSRQFTELREAGLIETRGRSLVRLLDVPALAQAAGQGRFSGTVQHI
jgi:CRP/FNR family transcriptional regulator, anaerobic regulatory protein